MTKNEQKTLHLTWLMAQIQYHILSANILTDDGKVSKDAEETLKNADKSLKDMQKGTLKLKGEEAKAVDILWNIPANVMLVINMFFCLIMVLLMADNIKYDFGEGILYFITAVIAFPIFFKYKNLSKSELFKWRIVRLIISIFFIIIVFNI